jgi:hypothetical protein
MAYLLTVKKAKKKKKRRKKHRGAFVSGALLHNWRLLLGIFFLFMFNREPLSLLRSWPIRIHSLAH